MENKQVSEWLGLREEYESSGMTKRDFARFKNMDEWKMKYVLRKGLQIKNGNKEVGFKKVEVIPPSISSQDNLLRIKTSYGAEISIPL